MKKFEFNHANKKWDSRKVFHYEYSGFTEFENGELIINHTNIHCRGYQNKYDVRMTTTRDCGMQLYLDEECTQPVKKAWLLQGGQQDMALDYEQKVAVHLQWWVAWSKQVPRIARSSTVVPMLSGHGLSNRRSPLVSSPSASPTVRLRKPWSTSSTTYGRRSQPWSVSTLQLVVG